MIGTLRGRILIIIAAIAVAGFYLYRDGLKLGLDLQGGMHLALEVSDPEGTLTPEARADATDRALRVIRTRIDEFGVTEPLIQKVGNDRIVVELAGVRDEERAKQVIERTAFLEFQLVKSGSDLAGALPRIDQAIVAALGPGQAPARPAPAEQPQQRVQELFFGRRDTAAAADTGAVAAQPTERPLTSLLLQGQADGEFFVAERDKATVDRYLALPEVRPLLPRDTELRWDAQTESRGGEVYRRLYVLDSRPFLTGDMLEDAVAGRDPQFNETVVNFELSRRGGRVFERVTGEHIGDRIAIVLDDQVFSAPVVQSRIGARGRIELNQAPLAEAQDLALVLRAGALPAPLQIIEQRQVGPSLGEDSVARGEVAGIVGVVLVLAIMVFFYRFAGLLAVAALAVYVLLILGGMAAFHATLTAPGIAGIILSIGMSVDANVLIFERIREELAAGRTVRAAVDSGFEGAMSAIIDSNLTTLITGLILYWAGTGPVRGFAVTLSIGIIASFFSAVFVTRTLFLAYLARKRPLETISIG